VTFCCSKQLNRTLLLSRLTRPRLHNLSCNVIQYTHISYRQSQASQHHDLQQRKHNYSLLTRTGRSSDNNFILRVLYLDTTNSTFPSRCFCIFALGLMLCFVSWLINTHDDDDDVIFLLNQEMLQFCTLHIYVCFSGHGEERRQPVLVSHNTRYIILYCHLLLSCFVIWSVGTDSVCFCCIEYWQAQEKLYLSI